MLLIERRWLENTSCSLGNIRASPSAGSLNIGYTMYLITNQQKEEAAGLFMAEGHSKDSLLSFLSYALSFGEIQSLRDYEAKKTVVAAAVSEDEQLVGFGNRAKNTWRDIWDSRDDGYVAFIVKKKCAAGTRMHRLQQYLQKKLHPPSGSTTTHPSLAPAEAMGMDQDEELEQAMLSISPSKHVQSLVSAPSSSASPQQAPRRKRG
ncbi:uncharacterized protein [Notothenia coriiceps]|uniref:Uncharacterized protein n=1 Tax=Notothenia coriiceps TaxID=8208 RepID=A0A6I9NTH9_9TELE|nr:PREDICTED: uncharacterized protein LOC104952634 [Notothenia coriiceps]